MKTWWDGNGETGTDNEKSKTEQDQAKQWDGRFDDGWHNVESDGEEVETHDHNVSSEPQRMVERSRRESKHQER